VYVYVHVYVCASEGVYGDMDTRARESEQGYQNGVCMGGCVRAKDAKRAPLRVAQKKEGGENLGGFMRAYRRSKTDCLWSSSHESHKHTRKQQ
jgi:hypothetical protein